MYKKIIAGIMSMCMLCPISVNAEENDVLYGDANVDGIVDICDITALKQHLVGLNELSDKGIENCGFFNNTVDVKSLGQIMKYVIKNVEELQFSYYSDGIYDKAEYTNISNNEDINNIVGNYVIVVIKHQYSMPNKIWTAEDFGVENIDSVEDMTAFVDLKDEELEKYISSIIFNQRLCINLKEKGADKVLKMINDLQSCENPVIKNVFYDVYAEITYD